MPTVPDVSEAKAPVNAFQQPDPVAFVCLKMLTNKTNEIYLVVYLVDRKV